MLPIAFFNFARIVGLGGGTVAGSYTAVTSTINGTRGYLEQLATSSYNIQYPEDTAHDGAPYWAIADDNQKKLERSYAN